MKVNTLASSVLPWAARRKALGWKSEVLNLIYRMFGPCCSKLWLHNQLYLCWFSSLAFYPEPHLLVSLQNKGQMEVKVTSEGGYPPPLLQWLMGNEDDVTNNTHTLLKQDEHTRLYSVNSKLNFSGNGNFSITFILKNEELGQEIRRNIDLFAGKTFCLMWHFDVQNERIKYELICLTYCIFV